MRSSTSMGYVYAKRGWLYIGFKDRTGKPVQMATEQPDTPEGHRVAREILRAREAVIDVAAAAATPTGRLTLVAWITVWLKRHDKDRGHRDDRGRLLNHVIPALGGLHLDEIRSRHVRAWLAELRRREAIAPRTIRHCYDSLRRVLREAQVDDLLTGMPWTILPGDLPAKEDADPHWRERAIYSAAEVLALMRDAKVPHDRRIVYAILGLAGLRWGEMAALTWADYSADEARLLVARSYSTARHQVELTKAGTVRLVPVHPMLMAALAEWKLGGWPRVTGRMRPEAEDLIVPSRLGAHRSVSHGRKKALADLRRLRGDERSDADPLFRPRRVHDLRRTFITALRAAGVPADLVRWISHGRVKDVLDAYTNTPWDALVAGMERAAEVYPIGAERRRQG